MGAVCDILTECPHVAVALFCKVVVLVGRYSVPRVDHANLIEAQCTVLQSCCDMRQVVMEVGLLCAESHAA